MTTNNRPTIDHGILSPSGSMSKRSLKAAKERNRRALFGDGLTFPSLVAQPSKGEVLLRNAKQLRELAARGMKPRAYIKQAEIWESQAQREVEQWETA